MSPRPHSDCHVTAKQEDDIHEIERRNGRWERARAVRQADWLARSEHHERWRWGDRARATARPPSIHQALCRLRGDRVSGGQAGGQALGRPTPERAVETDLAMAGPDACGRGHAQIHPRARRASQSVTPSVRRSTTTIRRIGAMWSGALDRRLFLTISHSPIRFHDYILANPLASTCACARAHMSTHSVGLLACR